ncbi:MAG TPA: TetR family transcriptional regulator [Thermoanaerobaculia bacterium]|jgi:AcrR family transcriptional regulator
MLKARDAERTRGSILAAATARFAAQGYDGTSVDQIATDAAANKALISYYFGGKSGLYAAVLREALSGVEEELRALRKSEEPAPERLIAFVRTFARFAADRPALPSIILREHLAGSERIDRSALPQFLEFFKTTQAIVRDGIREGTIRADIDAHALHLTLIGGVVLFLIGAPMRARLSKRKRKALTDPALEEYLGELRRLLETGITRRKAKR